MSKPAVLRTVGSRCTDCGGVITQEYIASTPPDLAAALRASRDLDLRIRVTLAMEELETETLRIAAQRVPAPPGTAALTKRIRAAGANRPGVFERTGMAPTNANRTEYTESDLRSRISAAFNEAPPAPTSEQFRTRLLAHRGPRPGVFERRAAGPRQADATARSTHADSTARSAYMEQLLADARLRAAGIK